MGDMATIRAAEAAADKVAALAGTWRQTGAAGDLLRLRDERIRAGAVVDAALDTAWGDRHAEPAPPDLFRPAPGELPDIALSALTPDTLASAMHHHGALIVRGFFTPRAALDFRTDIDAVLAALQGYLDARAEGREDDRPTSQKTLFQPVPKSGGLHKGAATAFLGMSGAVGTMLSPLVSQRLLDRFETLGLRGLLQGYFRDEPCLSFYKSVLRRAEPLQHPAEWHQDGAFMDAGIDSLNLWVALSTCGAGTDSPGMDLVPQRLRHIVQPGTNGALFKWSVSGATVAEDFAGPLARPRFEAGDALFFDHFNLHATSSAPEFTRARYAIETWFFPKSRCAVNQIPVLW